MQPPARHGVLRFGDARVDNCLGGGLALGNLHELAASGIEAETGAILAGFAACLLARLADPRPLLWVCSEGGRHHAELYLPGLLSYGLDPGRLILVRAADDATGLAAMETALREGAMAAVLGEIGRLGRLPARRLQLACLRHGSTCFVLRRWTWGRKLDRAVPQAREENAAVTRWQVTPMASAAAHREPGRPRWQVELTHARGGLAGTWIMEPGDPDATHPFRVVAEMADPAAAPDRMRRAG